MAVSLPPKIVRRIRDYTSVFSAQLTKFGPAGGSSPHSHTYNHAFYFLSGTCEVQIGEQAWHIKPGTFVKVPAHEQHSVRNTGTEDLIFLVIYDPPHACGGTASLAGT